jgi:putative addiction module component (TIGR02574 family)
MTDRAERLLTDALTLSPADRGELTAQLLGSLDGDADPDADAAWADEIRDRLAEVRSGAVTPVPWEAARRQILADDDDAG